MKKKIILGGIALVAIALGIVGMSAYEAHVVNVTARIENALTVPIEDNGLSFGSVIPEEVILRNFDIDLSQSFLGEGRVDDVEYVINQKPKCKNIDPAGEPQFAQVTEDGDDNFICPDGFEMMPLLCPYLSKHELDDAGAPMPDGQDAFHGPLVDWTMEDTSDYQVAGRLSKFDNDLSDIWEIGLHAPCYKGECAQDRVIPTAYQAPIKYKGKMYGCDLWIEVKGISPTPDKGTLTVIKHVINDDQTGSKNASDFSINVSGINADPSFFSGAEAPGTVVTLSPGDYSVTEGPMSGYAMTTEGDCSGTIAAGEHKICTIINNDSITCGDNMVSAGETCELPNTTDNSFCAQSTIQCDGTKTQTRDGFGNCNGICGCALDDFSAPVCVKDSCGATCAIDADCDDGNTGTADICDLDSCGCDHEELCGNGNIELGEECDDGNNISFDSCSASCILEPSIEVTKIVQNFDVCTKNPSDFQITLNGENINQNQEYWLTPGSYNISEADQFGYEKNYSVDCDENGNISLSGHEHKKCTITNRCMYGTITVNKSVINTPWNGSKEIPDFSLLVIGSDETTNVLHGVSNNFIPGNYTAAESGNIGYSASFSGNCNFEGSINLNDGDNLICTITNQVLPGLITMKKVVIGGSAVPTDFKMRVDGSLVPHNSSKLVTVNTLHTIDEDPFPGYTNVSIAGIGDQGSMCPPFPGGTLTLHEGENITCTITNTFTGTP